MTRDPQAARDIARNARVTLWNSVPALVALQADLAEDQDQRLWPELRIVLMSGDWIPKALPGRLEALKPDLQIVSLGGATEASIWSNYHLIGSQDLQHWTSIPYGKPLTNQTMQVLDTDLRPCPDWVAGEIYIGGKGLALGYWADKDKTEQAFVTHPKTKERLYRTGDLGRMRPGALIEFLGRQDQQVKIAGHRIELGEIEAALASHPDVHHAIATTHKNKNGNIAIAAFVTPRPGAQTPKREDLRQHLQTLLPSYIIPASFQALDRFPLTSNGKVDRGALERLLPKAGASRPKGRLGRSSVRQRLGALVTEILGQEPEDLSVNLFELGASSVELIRLGSRIQRDFGLTLRANDLAQLASLEDLAVQLEALEGVDSGNGEMSAQTWLDRFVRRQPMLESKEARALFLQARNQIRSDIEGEAPLLSLAIDPESRDLKTAFLLRRSIREFDRRPVSFEALSALLASLGRAQFRGQPKYQYGSAGGAYPVQSYLWAKSGRIEDVPGGSYYLHPETFALCRLGDLDEADLKPMTLANGHLVEEAAFLVFLVAEYRAIAPL